MIDPKLAARLKTAWNALTPEQQARIRPLFQTADKKLAMRLAQTPAPTIQHRELIYFQTVLEDRADRYAEVSTMMARQAEALGQPFENLHLLRDRFHHLQAVSQLFQPVVA